MATASPEFDPGPGDPAPDVTLHDPEGKRVSLKALRASTPGRPLLLAFFKVSCPICQLTWPYLQKIHTSYGAKGVRVIGVSQNDAAKSRDYYREFGRATFELLLDPEPGFAASNAFHVESVPHLVLLAPDGKIRKVFAGWQRNEMVALGETIGAEAKLPRGPVVAEDDPVPAWKAG